MGHAVSKHNDEIVVLDTFSYPLDIDFRFDNADLTNCEWRNECEPLLITAFTGTSAVNHSYDRVLQANPLVLGTTIHNVQNTGSWHVIFR